VLRAVQDCILASLLPDAARAQQKDALHSLPVLPEDVVALAKRLGLEHAEEVFESARTALDAAEALLGERRRGGAPADACGAQREESREPRMRTTSSTVSRARRRSTRRTSASGCCVAACASGGHAARRRGSAQELDASAARFMPSGEGATTMACTRAPAPHAAARAAHAPAPAAPPADTPAPSGSAPARSAQHAKRREGQAMPAGMQMRSPAATAWICAAFLLAALATGASAAALTCPTTASTGAISCWVGTAVTSAPTSTAAAHSAGVCDCTCFSACDTDGPEWQVALASDTENSCVPATCNASFAAATAPAGCSLGSGCGGMTYGYNTWSAYTTTSFWTSPKAESFPAGSVCWQYSSACNAAAVAAKMCPSTLLGFATTTYGAFNSADSDALAQCATQAPLLTSVQYGAASACVTTNCNQPPAASLAPPPPRPALPSSCCWPPASRRWR
jgi:hypothetical protein